HQEIGEPIQCAGIVSKRTIEKSGVTDPSLNKVRGAHIHSPNGSCLKIDAGETKAHIIDRHIFDKQLAKEAVNQGSKLWLKTRAVDWDNTNLVLKKEGVKKTLSPRVVVGADGIGSLIRRKVTDLKPKAFLSGAQVLLKDVDVRDTDFVELFLGNEFAPGFFSWFIPIDDDKGRLGLCV
ncbi:NAD(P)/FAD-dependent oxidoreductase, partial [archaeon SCG-AAA382B04]